MTPWSEGVLAERGA